MTSRAILRPGWEARRRRSLAVLLVAAGLGVCSRAAASESMGGAAPGAGSLQMDVLVDGLGGPTGEMAVYGGVAAGFALAEKSSAYLDATLPGDGAPRRDRPALRLGAISNVLEGPRYALDLFFETWWGDADGSQLTLLPGLEFSLDLESPLGPWGFYFRAAIPFSVNRRSAADADPTIDLFDVTPGLYFALAGVELYLEQALLIHAPGAPDVAVLENFGVAAGLTVPVTSSLLLGGEVSAVPKLYEPGSSYGVALGFMVALPNGPGPGD